MSSPAKTTRAGYSKIRPARAVLAPVAAIPSGQVWHFYYYAGSQRLAMRTSTTSTSTLNWIIGDHLGSTNVVADLNGNLLTRTLYKPWGEVRYQSGTLPTKYTYTGQYSHTADFGLMFYNARWYDPSLGRFAQADTIVPGAGNPMAWDRYAYVRNSPINRVDPNGHIDVSCQMDGCPDSQSASSPDYLQEIFLGTIKPPLKSENDKNYRNFGDNRGKYENDKNPNEDRYHVAIDAGFDIGEPIYAIAPGTVVGVGWSYDFGNYVIVEHKFLDQIYYSVYAHLGTSQEDNGITVEVGDIVTNDVQIGSVGDTKGGTTDMSPHLHFEVRTAKNVNVNAVNPFQGFYFWGYSQSEYTDYFLDLGSVFGYDYDYAFMPE